MEKMIDERLKDYKTWEEGHDPFEDFVGPLYFQEDEEGRRCAFVADERHVNGGGFMHGGMLMSFADFALFVIARSNLEEGIHAVTVSFNADFTSSVYPGDFVEATGEVIHETGSMIFIRGTVFVGERTVLRFSGVIKKIRPRK